jgi:hypothetical protein
MTSEVTVITAYYPLKSGKYSNGSYKSWLHNLCKIQCYLIIFTTETLALEIYQWRRDALEKTHVIVRQFDSFAMTCPSMLKFWEKQEVLDTTLFGNSELYAMWSLKQELVRIAINQNRFKSKWFCWCDAGIQRFAKLENFYMTFPHDIERLCVARRMHFLEVEQIPESYVDAWNENKPLEYPLPEITLGSGCIVGDAKAWLQFGEAYKDMLKDFALRGWFAGKETSVFFAILMEKKTEPFRLFYAKQFIDIPGIEWLCFPVMLGGNLDGEVDTRFEPLED